MSTAPFKVAESSTLSHGTAPRIKYWVLFEQGYGESYTTSQGNSTTVLIAVKWDDAADFKKFAMGFTTGYVGGLNYDRQTPLACPWANNQYLAAMDKFAVGNFSDDLTLEVTDPEYAGTKFEADPLFDNWPSCGFIVYSCTLVSLNYPIKEYQDLVFGTDSGGEFQRYVRTSRKTIARERKMPGYTFETDEVTPKPVPEVGMIATYEEEYVFTQMQVPMDLVPWLTAAAKLGKVNSATFEGMAPETLLFKGRVGELEPYVGPSGELYCDIPWLFGYRSQGWNVYPVGFDTAGGPIYVRIRQKGASTGTKPPYAATTFAPLFQPRAT